MGITKGTNRTLTRPTTRAVVPVIVAGLALLAGACGDADADAAVPTGPTTVSVVGDDFSFAGLPETVVAGSTLTLENTSAVELHEIVAVRLPDDEERTVAELLALPPDESGLTAPPSAVIIAAPEASGMAVVGTGELTEPGRYVLFCAIPIGADPDAYLAAAAESDGPPDVPGGAPHFTEGMWAELTVVAES